jgi:N-acetylneuraminic acid mutarotase
MVIFFVPKKLLILFCISVIAVTSFAQWERKQEGIKPRSEVTSVIYQDKIYTFFGFRDSLLHYVEPSAEVYEPALNKWTLLDSLPSNKAVTHTGMAVIDDNVWHVGGRIGRHPGSLTSEIWIYNITSNTWFPGPQLLDPITGNQIPWAAGGAALLGRTLHVFGGFITNACSNDQSTYHLTLEVDDWLKNPSQPAKWKNDLAPLPIKRNHFSTVVLGGKIYAIGGQFGHDCGGGQDKQYSHVYDRSTNTWTELPLLPTPRSHAEGSTFAMTVKFM